jgi:drug/metabolite transporter (DMT)-like permease
MSSNQIIGIALLVGGLVLVYLGYEATQSLGEQLHETLTGRFTDSAMWYFVVGAVAGVAGVVMLSRRPR